jgi:uncharacterized protein YebE (UPF0316 family)
VGELLAALAMAGLALVSVGLWTLRVALTAKGRKLAGGAVAGLEGLTFVMVFGNVLANLDSPARLVGYGLGVAAGTMLGLSTDQRLSSGRSEVRVVVACRDAEQVVDELHRRGWPATWTPGSGLGGDVAVLFVVVDDACVRHLTADLRALSPQSFWSVKRLATAHAAAGEPLPSPARALGRGSAS